MKILAVTDASRQPEASDIPTTAEARMPELISYTFNAISVRANTKDEIVAKLEAAMTKVLTNPSVQKELRKLGLEVSIDTSSAYAAKVMEEETRKWSSWP